MKITKIIEKDLCGTKAYLFYTNIYKRKKDNFVGEIDYRNGLFYVYTYARLRGFFDTYEKANKYMLKCL